MHGTSVFVAEFGGTRYQNETQCTDDGYLCSTVGPPECMNAPGRNYTAINNCQCGCDVFHQMLSGHRVRVVRYASSTSTSSGSSSDAGVVVETVCGSGVRGYRNGPAAEAEFDHPYDVAVFGTGSNAPDLLIADALNHAVRLYNATTRTVSTLIGTGKRGWRDHADALQAGLNYPTGLAVVHSAATGAPLTVFVADRGNNCVRRYSVATGALDTVAGRCDGPWGDADGPATTALFSGPSQLAVVPAVVAAEAAAAASGGSSAADDCDTEADVLLTLYVTDAANDKVRVVTGVGTAGATVATLEVDGLATGESTVQLSMPLGVAVDPAGDSVFVSSYYGSQVVQ